jgi:hypothetical protein
LAQLFEKLLLSKIKTGVTLMDFTNINDIEIQKIASPIWANIIAASNDKNYKKFSQDFSLMMLKEATQKRIEEQWHKNLQLTSLKEAPNYLGYLVQKNIIRVLWKQKFNNNSDECLGHLELIIEQGKVKVDGAQIL